MQGHQPDPAGNPMHAIVMPIVRNEKRALRAEPNHALYCKSDWQIERSTIPGAFALSGIRNT